MIILTGLTLHLLPQTSSSTFVLMGSHTPAFQPPAPLDSYSHSVFLSSPILTQLTEKTTHNNKEEIKRELLQLSHRKIMLATQIQTYSHTLLLGKKKRYRLIQRERKACTFRITRRQNNANFNLDVNRKVEIQSSSHSEFTPEHQTCENWVEEKREQRGSRT